VRNIFAASLLLALAACTPNPFPDSHARPAMSRAAMAYTARRTISTTEIADYRENYTIAVAGEVIHLTRNADGIVTSYPMTQELQFFDRNVSFDVDGIAGQTFRLYQAAFNRKPDVAGLGYWIDAIRKGQSLLDVAAAFQSSDEFTGRFGASLSSRQWISLIYDNVLHRQPDSAGLDWWVAALDSGSDKPSTLLGFSESKENKEALLPSYRDGIEYVRFGGPIAPAASSYENAKVIAATPIELPNHWTDASIKVLEPGEQITNGFAQADFFRDGQLSLVAFTQNFVPESDPNYGNAAGHIYFYKREDRKWVDHTSELLADQTGCITPRKVIVADFNGDGRPDVFAACHGIDRALKPGEHAGEHPRILLSRANGTYQNIDLGFDCYCHGAAAANLKRRGYADVLIADPSVAMQPFFLINNRDGTFSRNFNLLPNSTKLVPLTTVELIDFAGRGKFDAILAGGELALDFGTFVTTSWPTTILHNPGNGDFSAAVPTVLPQDLTFAGVLDIVFSDGYIYLNRTTNGKTNDTSYTATAIQKISYPGLQSTRLFTSTQKFGNGSTWVDWIIPYQAQIVSSNIGYGLSVSR